MKMNLKAEEQIKRALRRAAKISVEELELDRATFLAEAREAFREVKCKLEAARIEAADDQAEEDDD